MESIKIKKLSQKPEIVEWISGVLNAPIDRVKNIAILIQEIDDRSLEILLLRKLDKLTLEEVGKKFGVTRERIRQIESKTNEQIRQFLKNNNNETTKYIIKTYKYKQED